MNTARGRLWLYRFRRFFRKPRDLKDVALEYCRKHPEARTSIVAAGRKLDEAEYEAHKRDHRFTGSAPWAKCIYCGEPRESVASNECKQYKPVPAIEHVIRKEEALFEKTLERAKKIAARIDLLTVTGEELAKIHNTHGVDPSMIEAALGVTLPESLVIAYAEAYEKHKATGKCGLVRKVIVAKTK